MDEQTNRQIIREEKTYKWTDEQSDLTDKWTGEQSDRWKHEWTNFLDGQTNGQTGRGMEI